MTDGLHSQRLRFEKGEELGLALATLINEETNVVCFSPNLMKLFESYNNKYGVGERACPLCFLITFKVCHETLEC